MAALTGNADAACVSFAALCCRTAYTQAKELQLNAALSELVSSSQCSIVKYDTRDPQVLASIPIHACGAKFTLCARAIAGRVALSAAYSAVFEPLTYHTTPATIQ